MKIKYNSEMIAGAVFVIVAAVLWLLIPSQIQTMETSSINAQTIPRVAIGGLFIFSACLLLQGIFSDGKKEVVINKDTWHSESFKSEMRSVIFALFLIAYCFIIGILGFIISTILLSVAILIFYGARKWYYYAIPIVMVCIVYYIFGVLLHISLP